MRRSIVAFMAALTLLPMTLRSEMDLAPPIKVTWNGFMQHWLTLAETGNTLAKGPEYNQSGSMLKRFRIRMGAEVYDGLNVVMIPELAGVGTGGSTGFFLLDAYAVADLSKYLLDFNVPLSVTVGQFKTPFGLNRMYAPPQLAFVNYSSISNAVFGSTNFWDSGLMLSYAIPKLLKLDVAMVEGLGPNQATAAAYNFGASASQDYVARLDWMVLETLTVGGSVYNGEHFTGNGGAPQAFPYGTTAGGGRTWSGAHLQFKTFGKGLQLDLEMINRGVDRGAFAGVLSYYIVNWLQLAAGYDRLEVYGTANSGNTRYQLGVNCFPGGTVRLSLNQEASAAGVDQSLRPGSLARTILQTQVTW